MIRVGSPEDHGLALAAIQIDGGTQSRANVNDQVVNEYAEAIKAGATFPPIVVFYDGKKHWLADGFHRFHAYQKIGREKVAADIRQGTRRDAILHSVGANETHGLRRTRDDKRRAVETLLNDAEWGKWTDREIARRCAVSPQTVANVRADTVQNGQSDERTYVHPKTGKPTTMKTAGINAGRNQFQAKASEDNGAPIDPAMDEGAGMTGEASRLASGRTDAGEAASVDLPTISDAEREADAIQAPFDRASDEGRALFLARNNLTPTKKGGDDAKSAQVPSEHCDLINRRRQDETHEQDRSESRQVRSGRNIAGVAAPRVGTSTEAPAESVEISATNSPSGDGAFSEVKGTARPENAAGVEPSSSDNPSTAPTVEPEATPSPPPASGNPFNPDPQTPVVATADQAHQASQLSAQNDDVPHVVGQVGLGPVEHCGHAMQEDASATQARNEPGSVSGATVTNFTAMSKADQIRLLRPHCQHPDDLEKCAGSGRTHCHACRKAMAEGEAA